MRIAPLALLLLVAFPSFASFEFEPAAPTDSSYITLHVRERWTNVCGPGNVQIARSGNRIEVDWTVNYVIGCFNRLTTWDADVPLGLLEAGEYQVVLEINGGLVADLPLVVSDATPAVIVEPNVLSSLAPTEVRIATPGFFPGPCMRDSAVVTIDGSTVPSHADGCSIIATFPAHAPGAANVTVREGTDEITTVAAVRYIDPGATPDPSLFERVLVPVLFNGPGAFGSQWRTEVDMFNRTPRTLNWLPEVSETLPPVAYNTAATLGDVPNHLTGLVLFLPRGYDVRFGAVFRDVSRDASQWGTELPIVREGEFQSTIVLPNVPFDPRYRLQLRIYGIEGFTYGVHVSIGEERWAVSVTGPCSLRDVPCNSDQPAFASVDLGQTFPLLTGKQKIAISAAPFDFTRKIWAFVTVTNNDTQQVTVITPQ